MKALPTFLSLRGGRSPSTSTIHSYTTGSALPYHPTRHRTLSNMNTLPSGNGGPSLTGDPCQYDISNARTDSNRTVMLPLTRDDIDPDKPDNNGQTPLLWASLNGHEEVVRLLLARDDVNPDKPDNNGRTPLWLASFDGHEGVVRLLLARDDVNPDKPDNDS